MSLNKISERLTNLGCEVEVEKNKINVNIDDLKASFECNEEWLKAIRGFYRARQYQFDGSRHLLSGNKFVEFQVVKLDPGFSYKPFHRFVDSKSNEVILGSASREFLLSYFESNLYEEIFHFIKKRIERRFLRGVNAAKRRTSARKRFRVEDLFLNFSTAKYIPKRKLKRDKLLSVGFEKIKSSLFNLAYSKHESWEIRDEIKSKGFIYKRLTDEEAELDIPSANYDSKLVSHYKVAKSSLFPGQVFLSYYHILEYFFLRVADEELFHAAKVQLNDPRFKATYNNVTKLLSVIKKNDNTGDEQKMLRSVLRKYVPEEDYIDFVENHEKEVGEKIITGKNLNIFGDKFNIKLEKGHALVNSALLLKHIRNSIVHSSDRYTREDCYLPFSETDEVVASYIPIIQFMAEKVIFSTAN